MKKINWATQEHKTASIRNIVFTIAIIMILIGFLLGIDALNWQNTLQLIKQNVPTGGSGSTYVQGFGYVPFVWNGNITGKISIQASQDGTIVKPTKVSYWLVQDKDATISNGYINNGFTVTNQRADNDYRWHEIEGYVAYVEIGDKIYRTQYVGQKQVDYPITQDIIDQNRSNIFYDVGDPVKIEEYTKFLLTFTHDSLHQFIVDVFSKNQRDAFTIPNIYAYRLDQIILGQVKYENVYEQVWTGQRKGKLLLIYSVDGKERIKWFYNPQWIGCNGGGYSFSDWK